MSVKQEIRAGVSIEKAYRALVRGFEKTLKMQLEKERTDGLRAKLD